MPTQTQIRGVALVIVLAFLVLLSGLIVAFISSIGTESQASKQYQSSLTVKQLATSAANLVTGQINDATRSVKVPGQLPAAGDRLAWASQPGMIRTWDDNGKGWKIFKLYSARDMVAEFDAAGRYSTATELAKEVPDDWPKQRALFTDLNEPVLVEDTAGGILRGGKKLRASFPIVDPLALLATGTGATRIEPVEGFSIEKPPGYGGPLTTDSATGKQVVSVSESMDPSAAAAPGTTGNPAPMPVAWMYVLKDGTLTVPTGSEDAGLTATWKGAEPAFTPSRQNPIVGRFAFWTDDECSKINLNTASEPTPWDTPRAICIQDLRAGQFQPAKQEFQRFPGHPFTTALSPVFFPNPKPPAVAVPVTAARKEDIYRLIPRVGNGGTQGATVQNNGSVAVSLDEDRLFSNVDEFLFRMPTGTATSRTANTIMDPTRLRRSRFFLTANSRSPELNLFGQPRISLWPEHSNIASRTAYDKLAAFCTTLGTSTSGNTYHFQRLDSTSPTADWVLADAKGVKRNQLLYKYLQTLTNRAVPGFGGNFKDKWTTGAITDRDQILTEVFDYIRCTNLKDPQSGATPYATNGSLYGQVAPIIPDNDTKGFGRFHTISQIGMHFICSQDGAEGVSGANGLSKDQRWIEAALLIEPFSPSLGWYRLQEDMFFDVKFLTPMTIDGNDLKMSSVGKALTNKIGSGWHNNGRERGGAGGLRGPIQAFGGGSYAWMSKASPRVQVDASKKKTMTFSGGNLQIDVYAGNAATPAKLIQTFTMAFFGGTFPIPDLVKTPTDDYRPGGITTSKDFWWTFASRYSSTGSTPHAPGSEYAKTIRRWVDSSGPPGFKKGGLFREEDVVRTIVPDHGDIRLVAAQKSPAAFVKVRDDKWNSDYHFLHIFSEAVGTHTLFGNCNEATGADPATNPNRIPASATDDQLHGTGTVAYHYSRLPEIRPGAGKKYNLWGDYDNGVAQATDGAFINKPDEGNTKATNSQYFYWSWDFSEPTEVFFSPNRLVPSAGMLGSLPTGVKRNLPWQTLLFRKQKDHPGNGVPVNAGADGAPYKTPPDHLFMDLFWMPVIEPYAMSEPFSTTGKINLNYEIAPFSYIRRATAMYGVMKSEEPLAIPNAASKFYKLWDHETNDNPKLPSDGADQDPGVRDDWTKAFNGQAPFDQMRRPINMVETLQQCDDRFKGGDIFRSATEICDLYLVRLNEKLADYVNNKIWPQNVVTGDNTRERPYTNLYAKLTTRSNVFTIHTRAQVVQVAAGSSDAAWATWKEGRDTVTGDFRGSTIIERYIDPADPSLVDFASKPDEVADAAYKFRVVATKKFVP